MKTKKKKWLSRSGLVALSMLAATTSATPGSADEFIVEMKNRGESGALVFEPAFLNIAPGDTVIFQPDSRNHNVQSMEAMIPEGGSEWKGGFGDEVSVTFTVDGVYGYRCNPHYISGMVGLIVVGDDLTNLDQAKAAKHMGLANQRFSRMFEELNSQQMACRVC